MGGGNTKKLQFDTVQTSLQKLPDFQIVLLKTKNQLQDCLQLLSGVIPASPKMGFVPQLSAQAGHPIPGG